MNGVFLVDKFQQLLHANWSGILNKNLLIRKVLEDARDTDYPKLNTSVKSKMEFSVTKFAIANAHEFDLWIEFTAPKGDRVVIGSHLYKLKLSGELILSESVGTEFLTES